jgi:hypothetical protein
MSTLLSLDENVLSLILRHLGSDVVALARLASTCVRLRRHASGLLARMRVLDVSSLGRRASAALRSAGSRTGALHSLVCCDLIAVSDDDIASVLRRNAATLSHLKLQGLRRVTSALGDGLRAASPLARLVALDLRGCGGVRDDVLSAVLLRPDGLAGGNAATLRRLDLSDTGVSDAGVGLLHLLPGLLHVSLDWTPRVDGVRFLTAGGSTAAEHRDATAAGVGDVGLTRWLAPQRTPGGNSPLPLRSLSLQHRRSVTPAAVAVLALRCTRLRALDVSHTRMPGPELLHALCAASASFAPHLRVLRFAAPAGSARDDDVAELARVCVRLRELDLSLHDALTDEALASLATLPRLRSLTLVRNNVVTLAGMRALLQERADTMRALHCVRCTRCGPTALTTLAAEFPACAIEWE